MLRKRRVIFLAFGFGLVAWLIDAILDVYFFYEGTFWDSLILDVPKHDMYFRLVILLSSTIFGIIISEFILKQKKTEIKIQESLKWNNIIMASIQSGIIVVDAKTHIILEANNAALAMSGSDESEVVGQICHKNICPNSEGKCPITDRKLTVSNAECVLLTKSGKPLDILKTAVLLELNGKEYIVENFVDLSDRNKARDEKRKLEEQLFQAQKMESIGRLAGGVAHDFNNILSSILGYSELLQLKFDDESTKEGKAANAIIKGVDRAANLTKQLLGFARGGKYDSKPLSINEVIREILKVSESVFEKNIEVKLDLEKNINNVEADKNQLDQVLTNLLINSKDAMADGGEIYIKTENISPNDEFLVSRSEFKPGHYVLISISDSGKGMTKEVKENIFEPFFTTKGIGKGTGLGLATVFGIVKNHNGYIYCFSESGKGTTFKIFLPVTDKKVVVEKSVAEAIAKGTETILIVDDEEGVLESAAMALESLGYKVLSAFDGKEAVKIYANHKDEIDLVLLDMVMPVMGGEETYNELKKLNPDVLVILASGYSRDGKANEIMKTGVQAFIQKPFKLNEFAKVVNETLRKKQNLLN